MSKPKIGDRGPLPLLPFFRSVREQGGRVTNWHLHDTGDQRRESRELPEGYYGPSLKPKRPKRD